MTDTEYSRTADTDRLIEDAVSVLSARYDCCRDEAGTMLAAWITRTNLGATTVARWLTSEGDATGGDRG